MRRKDQLSGGAACPARTPAATYDDLAFALPANASATYCKRKTSRPRRNGWAMPLRSGRPSDEHVSKLLKDDASPPRRDQPP